MSLGSLQFWGLGFVFCKVGGRVWHFLLAFVGMSHSMVAESEYSVLEEKQVN